VLRNEEAINSIYDSANESSRAENQMVLNAMLSKLQADRDASTRATDQKLTDVYVNALRQGKNYDEVQNASGLGSGNMAQARLAQDNQLQGDLTTLRAAQQNIDAGIERERGTLAQQYAAAIQQAQANNDLARAQALFEAAQQEEARLNQQKANAANLMAGVGDYARLAELYGLTAEELALLMGKTGGGSAGSGGSGMSGGGGFGGGSTAGAAGGSPVTEDDLLRQKMKQDYA
jgi:transcriptional regulator with GAF, ATPase, and Fis domain